jgi:hypothetical protein
MDLTTDNDAQGKERRTTALSSFGKGILPLSLKEYYAAGEE